MLIFSLLCLSSFILNGAGNAEEGTSVSATVGDSVTLHTDVIKHRDDLIVWYYGSEHTVIARINGKAGSFMLSDDERFKDRLKLNHQTGDLTITHLTSHHSGRYKLKISRNRKPSYKTFSVTVNDQILDFPGILNKISPPSSSERASHVKHFAKDFTANVVTLNSGASKAKHHCFHPAYLLFYFFWTKFGM